MAGTIPISMTQQFDEYSKPLSGGQLYIIQAGTVSTPQDAFADIALTIEQPYPMTLDAAGRVPQFFLADGTVKIRLQDKNGVVQLTADQVMVIGPSSGGGGGGGTIDPTTIYQTGDLKPRYGTGDHTGFVRCNKRTIGSATSGATERANLDCQALFLHLWGADASLVVSGGRGASAATDWGANKQIETPDYRGYSLAFLDDMGNTPAGRITATYFISNPTVLGAQPGGQSTGLATANMPPYTPTGSITNGAINSTFTCKPGQVVLNNIVPGTSQFVITGPGGGLGVEVSSGTVGSPQLSSSFLGTAQGGTGAAFSVISPRKLATLYIKL